MVYDYQRSECSGCGAAVTRLEAWPVEDPCSGYEVGVLSESCPCGKLENVRSRLTTRCPDGLAFVFEEAAS